MISSCSKIQSDTYPRKCLLGFEYRNMRSSILLRQIGFVSSNVYLDIHRPLIYIKHQLLLPKETGHHLKEISQYMVFLLFGLGFDSCWKEWSITGDMKQRFKMLLIFVFRRISVFCRICSKSWGRRPEAQLCR